MNEDVDLYSEDIVELEFGQPSEEGHTIKKKKAKKLGWTKA